MQEAVGVDQDRNLGIGFYWLDPGENVVVSRILYGFPEQMAIGHRFAQDYPTLMFFSLGRLILAVFNDLQAVRARNMRVIR